MIMRRNCGRPPQIATGTQLRVHCIANAYGPAVSLNHFPNQFLEAGTRTPSKPFPCFRSIPQGVG